jgi:hypothetical protein
MKPEILKRWVAALRSGKFKQTRNRLKWNGAHCCLGVLCELHRRSTRGRWSHEQYLDCAIHMPQEVAEWAGLKDTNPILITPGSSHSATFRNDTEHLTFPQIANAIERTQKAGKL